MIVPYRQDSEGTCWTCQGAGFVSTAATYGPPEGCWVCEGEGWLSHARIVRLGWDLPLAYYGLTD